MGKVGCLSKVLPAAMPSVSLARIMAWYYAIGGQQNGPVSEDELNRLVREGTVQPDTLVWQDGWPQWRAYRTLISGSASVAEAGSVEADTAVCAVSARRLPKKDMLEFEGRWVSAEHKEEFFQRLREGVALPRDVVYASFGRRFMAKFVDGLIVFAVNFGVTMLITAAFGAALSGSTAGAMAILLQVIVQVSSIGLAMCYALFFIRKYDATPGKKALGLRLLRADGAKLTKGRIVGRHFAEYLSSFTLLIGYLMAAFDKEQRRALHDRVCDTRVIDVRGQ